MNADTRHILDNDRPLDASELIAAIGVHLEAIAAIRYQARSQTIEVRAGDQTHVVESDRSDLLTEWAHLQAAIYSRTDADAGLVHGDDGWLDVFADRTLVDLRGDLVALGEQRRACEQARAAVMETTTVRVGEAHALGVQVAELARLTGLTRQTVYALLDRM